MKYWLSIIAVLFLLGTSCGTKDDQLSDLKAQAERGDAVAQFNLGSMYRKGEGVTQDYDEAFKWYRKAAEQGYAKAQFNLGLMYANGHGVAQDNVEAYMWLSIAAAEDKLSNKQLDSLKSNMTSTQIKEAESKAETWLAMHRKKQSQ